MPYIQQWGVSRSQSPFSALQSPLNNHNKYHCDPGNKNEAGECVGWEYSQNKKEEKKPETKYTKDPKDWNTWPPSERPSGWSLPGSKNPDGSDSDNSFSKDELEEANEAVDLKRRQDMVAGGDTWKNSELNMQPEEGTDYFGNTMTVHKDGKTYQGGEDVTDAYNRKMEGKSTTEEKLDAAQTSLGAAGFVPKLGAIPDLLNATISGVRGTAGLFGLGERSAGDYYGDALWSTAYAVPYAGDYLAGTTKGGKVLKNLSKWSKGTDKFYSASKSGKWNQPMYVPPTASNTLNRGLYNFIARKNKNTQYGNLLEGTFGKDTGGTIAAVTSGKTGVKNIAKSTDTEDQKET